MNITWRDWIPSRVEFAIGYCIGIAIALCLYLGGF